MKRSNFSVIEVVFSLLTWVSICNIANALTITVQPEAHLVTEHIAMPFLSTSTIILFFDNCS